MPVLIYDKNLKIISAIHAGWKSVYKEIIKKVVKFLIKKGSNTKNLVAVIGPSISEKSYEVQKDFKDKFLKKDKQSKFFFKIRKNKTYFGLNKYVYYHLKKLGIKNLEIIKKNIVSLEEEILYVKGSGWDLEFIEKAGFSPVRMDHMLNLSRLDSLTNRIIFFPSFS